MLFDAYTHEYGAISDYRKVMEIIGEIDGDIPEEESRARRDAGHQRANELIRANEPRCRRLAERLIEEGRVEAAEFLQLMDGTCRC